MDELLQVGAKLCQLNIKLADGILKVGQQERALECCRQQMQQDMLD